MSAPSNTYVTFVFSRERSRDFKRALSIAKSAHISTVTVDGKPYVEFRLSMADDTEDVFRFKITDGGHGFTAFLYFLELRNLRTFMRLVKPGDVITIEVWANNGPASLREVGYTIQTLVFKNKGIEVSIDLLGHLSGSIPSPVKIFEKRIWEVE